jgi:TonB family protein
MPAPPPVAAPAERAIGTVFVTASVLNLRREASMEAEVLAQVKRGAALAVLERGDGWVRVRAPGGEVGWVASRYVAAEGEVAKRTRAGCPPDSDYAFEKAPAPAFNERGPHGLVVVEASVNASGIVTSTRLVSNTTGDESLAALAVREIRDARFSPPIVDCQPRAFFFTYRRAF